MAAGRQSHVGSAPTWAPKWDKLTQDQSRATPDTGESAAGVHQRGFGGWPAAQRDGRRSRRQPPKGCAVRSGSFYRRALHLEHKLHPPVVSLPRAPKLAARKP